MQVRAHEWPVAAREVSIMEVVVIGGTGRVASALVAKIRKLGANVRSFGGEVAERSIVPLNTSVPGATGMADVARNRVGAGVEGIRR
jgi:nucleoside-diphosphate-sugar epimerase